MRDRPQSTGTKACDPTRAAESKQCSWRSPADECRATSRESIGLKWYSKVARPLKQNGVKIIDILQIFKYSFKTGNIDANVHPYCKSLKNIGLFEYPDCLLRNILSISVEKLMIF